jgi:hypothetical protein
MRSSEFRSWIVEEEGSVVGVLSRASLESALADGKAEENLIRQFHGECTLRKNKGHSIYKSLQKRRALFSRLSKSAGANLGHPARGTDPPLLTTADAG